MIDLVKKALILKLSIMAIFTELILSLTYFVRCLVTIPLMMKEVRHKYSKAVVSIDIKCHDVDSVLNLLTFDYVAA